MIDSVYLAMTATEISRATALPPKIAYMACHFSAYTWGLSNLPQQIPPDSCLILNDRIPISGHDPKTVATQLEHVVRQQLCSCVLLDFQRPEDAQTTAVCRSCLEYISCPVGISDLYAKEFDCPVFLPPVPPDQPIDTHLSPWMGRELWLEVSTDSTVLTVTHEGCQARTHPPQPLPQPCFANESLHCTYRQEIKQAQIQFTLYRTAKQQDAMLAQAQSMGVQKFIGLYQQLQDGL